MGEPAWEEAQQEAATDAPKETLFRGMSLEHALRLLEGSPLSLTPHGERGANASSRFMDALGHAHTDLPEDRQHGGVAVVAFDPTGAIVRRAWMSESGADFTGPRGRESYLSVTGAITPERVRFIYARFPKRPGTPARTDEDFAYRLLVPRRPRPAHKKASRRNPAGRERT